MKFPTHIVAAGALVTNQKNEVLLVKNPHRGWEFPGGQIENGEDWDNKTFVTTKVIFDFLATAIGGSLKISEESVEVGWFDRDVVLDMISEEWIVDRMKDMLEFDGQLIYKVYSSRPYEVYREENI